MCRISRVLSYRSETRHCCIQARHPLSLRSKSYSLERTMSRANDSASCPGRPNLRRSCNEPKAWLTTARQTHHFMSRGWKGRLQTLYNLDLHFHKHVVETGQERSLSGPFQVPATPKISSAEPLKHPTRAIASSTPADDMEEYKPL